MLCIWSFSCPPTVLFPTPVGTQIITERLEKPINEVCDVFFTVSLNGPLMTEEQRHKLNPLVVKVHSATNMPNSPLDYEELRLR